MAHQSGLNTSSSDGLEADDGSPSAAAGRTEPGRLAPTDACRHQSGKFHRCPIQIACVGDIVVFIGDLFSGPVRAIGPLLSISNVCLCLAPAVVV